MSTSGQLNKIGWHAVMRELAGANYFVVVGNQATKAQIGFTDWFEDYPYPTDWFQVLQYGPNIHQQHNNNYSNVNFSSTNNTINTLGHLPPAQAFSTSTNDKLGHARQDAHGQVRERGAVPERCHHVVLLVDDEPQLRRLRRLVRRRGTDVPEVTR